MTPHTPTPWRYALPHEPWGHIYSDTAMLSSDDALIATVGTPHLASLSEAEANAAHIVKCVNLHDELLGLIERTVGSLRFATNNGTRGSVYEREWLKEFEAVLTKATEERGIDK